MIAKKIEEKINNEITRSVEKQPANVPTNAISSFYVIKDPFKKDDVQQKNFCKTLAFWLWKITYHCNLSKIYGWNV